MDSKRLFQRRHWVSTWVARFMRGDSRFQHLFLGWNWVLLRLFPQNGPAFFDSVESNLGRRCWCSRIKAPTWARFSPCGGSRFHSVIRRWSHSMRTQHRLIPNCPSRTVRISAWDSRTRIAIDRSRGASRARCYSSFSAHPITSSSSRSNQR